jgi:hypothetical protein
MQLSRAYCGNDDIPLGLGCRFANRKPEPSAAKTAKPEQPVSALSPSRIRARRHKSAKLIIRS